MKIAVMGTGGVGGYFGGRLAQAGHDVSFIARGAHLAAIRQHGLTVDSGLGGFMVKPAKATPDPAEIGLVDIVLFCVKLYDTEGAGQLCRPLLGTDTAVVSLQNGIDSEERLMPILGRRHVCGGVAYIPAEIVAPGVVRQRGTLAKIDFGELDGVASARLQALLVACQQAGVAAEQCADIERRIWAKFVVLAPFAAACCLARQEAAPLLADPDTRRLLEDGVREAIAIARAKGIGLPDDSLQRSMRFFEGQPPGARASMLTDLERGNRLELEWLSGNIVRLGRELGVPTPVHEVACVALRPYAGGRAAGSQAA
ncbi:MAG: 2-dehydropantoate 2-reductase [Alphaproteobacteria bacterium]|nr:2-dehydropantoate 2-reductase [Alphaproteobacteria bacterium]